MELMELMDKIGELSILANKANVLCVDTMNNYLDYNLTAFQDNNSLILQKEHERASLRLSMTIELLNKIQDTLKDLEESEVKHDN